LEFTMKPAHALSLAALTVALAALATNAAWAKLPAPVLTDEAKAKAAEAAAKTAHGNKVADYKLCLSMDRVAASVADRAKKEGKTPKVGTAPPCADPGAFVYVPAPPAPAPGAAVVAGAPAPAAAPAAAAPAAANAAPAGAATAAKAAVAGVAAAAAPAVVAKPAGK
jgi:hypothetical protein